MRHLCLAGRGKNCRFIVIKAAAGAGEGGALGRWSQQHKKVMMSDGGHHHHQRWDYTGSGVDTADHMLPQLYPLQWRSSVRLFFCCLQCGHWIGDTFPFSQKKINRFGFAKKCTVTNMS